MSNSANRKPVWQNEDWMATFIGLFILLLAIIGWLPLTPKSGKWTTLAEAFPQGAGTIWSTFILFVTMGILTFVGGIFLKFDLKRYIPGFLIIFLLGFIALIIADQKTINYWGIEYVLWALVFGLIISNVFRVPEILKAAGQIEFFIKIGLAASLMALWGTLSLERKETGEKPSFMEVWYRFPKFVIGFLLSSLIVSFFTPPILPD